MLPFGSESQPAPTSHARLSPRMPPVKIEELLKTKYVNELKRYAVSKRVNRVENNSKECIEPFKDIND